MRTMTDQRSQQPFWLTMEGDCIRSLLAGNDTQCFSTEQYVRARDAWGEKHIGASRESLGIPLPPIETTRQQIRGIGLVVEVSPDVWTLKELAHEMPLPVPDLR